MSAATRIDGLQITPEAVVSSWPREWPLAVVWSGGGDERGRSRWTLIGRPSASLRAGAAKELDGVWGVLRGRREMGTGETPGPPAPPPFRGGWVGWLSYDAGRVIEPRAGNADGGADDRGWPFAAWARVDDALVHDRQSGDWWGLGVWRELVAGVGEARSDLGFEISDLRSQMGRARYLAAVERVIEYIRAGDVYQVNLAHRLSGAFSGSGRDLFLALMRAARPWYGGYVEMMDGRGRARAVASASPELFLGFDPVSRRVLTRPMKGTRRGGGDPRELAGAEKDRAELNMIVDLMRNDLGRVCEFGSVRVEAEREIERHGIARGTAGGPDKPPPATPSGRGLLQATASVSGRVRDGATVADVLVAAFPGGSVTGAPKIRAMQVIDELEPVRRGPYCGCFGWVGDDGAATFNIMIRTALITGAARGPAGAPASVIGDGVLDYSVGAGIVADSDPASEWEETMDKAGIMSGLHTGTERPARAARPS